MELEISISAADLRKKLGLKDGKTPAVDYAQLVGHLVGNKNKHLPHSRGDGLALRSVVPFNKVTKDVLERIAPPKDGNDGKDATVDEEKLAKKILKQVLKHIPEGDTMNQVGYASGGANQVTFLSNGVRVSDHVTEINFSTNITPVYSGNGRITLTASIASTTYSETPVGSINGSNKAYTVTNTIGNVLNFHINGQYIHPSEYATSGSTITFVTALDASLSGTGFTIVYV